MRDWLIICGLVLIFAWSLSKLRWWSLKIPSIIIGSTLIVFGWVHALTLSAPKTKGVVYWKVIAIVYGSVVAVPLGVVAIILFSRWRKAPSCIIMEGVEDKDANQEALEQVRKATDSELEQDEELLESPDLQRQWREAKEKLKKESPLDESCR